MKAKPTKEEEKKICEALAELLAKGEYKVVEGVFTQKK